MRGRAMANKSVSVAAYSSAVTAWINAPPHVDLLLKVGPNVCKDLRRVTPAAYESVRLLIEGLLSAGLSNGVIQSVKLREALFQAS
eukprot:3460882-Alexandrium_andersonii.AAC.1